MQANLDVAADGATAGAEGVPHAYGLSCIAGLRDEKGATPSGLRKLFSDERLLLAAQPGPGDGAGPAAPAARGVGGSSSPPGRNVRPRLH